MNVQLQVHRVVKTNRFVPTLRAHLLVVQRKAMATVMIAPVAVMVLPRVETNTTTMINRN
jgi:hypothetical protein